MAPSSKAAAFAVILFAASGMIALAQDAFWQYRLGADYSGSVAWQVNREQGKIDWCPCDGLGESFDHRLLLSGTGIRQNALFAPIGLYGSLGVALTVERFRSNPYDITPWFDEQINRLVFPVAEFQLHATSFSLHADAGLLLSPDSRWMLRLGAWLEHRMLGTFTLTEVLQSPTDRGYSGGDLRERQKEDGDQLVTSKTAWGPQLVLGYTIPLTPSLSVMTEISGFLNADVLRSLSASQSLGLGAGISLLWTSFPEEGSIDPGLPTSTPAAHIQIPTARQPRRTSIEMFTLGANGEQVPFGILRSEQRYTRRKIPVFPIIYFDRNSALLPVRYRQINPTESPVPTLDRTTTRSAVDQYYDVLNILGSRLHDHIDLAVVLTGFSSPDEPTSIAMARAESVQLYLRNIWDVKAAQIRIEAKPGKAPRSNAGTSSGDEWQAVECSSPQQSLFEPTSTSAVVREFHTAPIRLNPTIHAESGVQEWSISITQKGKEIARYSSESQATNKDIDVSLLLQEADGTSPLEPLQAELTVKDSNGVVTVARDVLDFKQSHDLFPADRPERVSMTTTFVLPSPLRAGLAGETKSLMKEAASAIQQGDHVRIYPLLERTGGVAIESEQVTRRHVQHLANMLLIELGPKQAQITIGAGEYTLPRETRLPELPYLSSLLCITIEHELK